MLTFSKVSAQVRLLSKVTMNVIFFLVSVYVTCQNACQGMRRGHPKTETLNSKP
jgi:hypothetical protein